ncbi:hypothetical protein ACHQM5_011371 [Ranunculus cassubicifolius]
MPSLGSANVIFKKSYKDKPKEEMGLAANNLLGAQCHVKSLKISAQIITHAKDVSNHIQEFGNLVKLEVDKDCDYVSTSSLLLLPRIYPHLATIFFTGDRPYFGEVEEDWISDAVPRSCLLHLKKVRYSEFVGHRVEFGLVQYLVANTTVLEEMKININWERDRAKDDRSNALEKLLKMRRVKMRGHKWSKTRKKETNVKDDRLSALPDEVIYHILSFLEMREVVKTTCLLSNKWKYFWMSTPTLRFDNGFDNGGPDCDFPRWGCRPTFSTCKACLMRRDRFKHFVNNVLNRRSSNLVKFQLEDQHKVNPALVNEWVNAALARKVQDVDISIDVTKILLLPQMLFSSDVKVLKLRLKCDARVPNLMCAAAWIKKLDLEHVTLPDGNTNGELVLSFSALESLRVARCDITHLKVISISTPVLESLEMRKFLTGKDRSWKCKIKTCTPNLKSLTVLDYMWHVDSAVNYHMENLSSIVSADICVVYDSEYVEECIKFWIEAVSWMYNVQNLKLPVSNIQLLLDSPKLLTRLPEVFHNLKHVMLDVRGRKNFHMKTLRKFLERAPHIETLILQGRDPIWYISDRFEEEDEEWAGEEWIRNPPSFSHMVSFEFQNFKGLNGELKFLEFVLERAIVLKKMIIKSKKELLKSKRKEEILSFPRSSSSVSILFQIT